MADTYGTGPIAPANTRPEGAFGNGGGPTSLPGPIPPGGDPPIIPWGSQSGGVASLPDGSPEGGDPPSSYSTPLEASALNGGPQRIPAGRAPESGDGTGQ